MRIGIDARSLLEPYPSGVSYYTAQLLHTLGALTDRSDTICLFTSGYQVGTDRLAPFLRYPRVEWKHLPWPNKLFNSLSLIGLAPHIDQVLGGVDVLFLPNWNFFPHTANVPYVMTVHDCAPQLYAHFFSLKQSLWHKLIQPQRLMQQAKHIIAVSQRTASDIHRETVTTIYSGSPNPVTAVPVAALPEQYVLVLGTVEARKNVQAVMAAMEQVWKTEPALHLVILGDAKQSDRVQIDDRCHMLGYRSEGEKWYVLQHAQALVYPSIYEGFGFPPLEALAAGVPVIASFSGAIPEVCGQAATYVNPYSVADIAQAIIARQPFNSEVAAQQLAKFNWETTARATLQVLQQSAQAS